MSKNEENVIEVRDLYFSYSKTPFLKDINFTVNKGEIFGFLGPSGAGKSTIVWSLMEMLEDYNAVATGEICFAGDVLQYQGTDLQQKKWNC